MTSTCPVCQEPIEAGYLMCTKHWNMVPTEQQQEVNRTWGRMQRVSARSGFGVHVRNQYRVACDAAIASARKAPNGADERRPL